MYGNTDGKVLLECLSKSLDVMHYSWEYPTSTSIFAYFLYAFGAFAQFGDNPVTWDVEIVQGRQ